MAPESERAKCPRCGSTERATRHLLEPPGSDFYLGNGIPCENAWHEPTLTCSEVVERLAKECVPTGFLDTARATAILHSWRERRVQELEAGVRELRVYISSGYPDGHHAVKMIDRLLPTPKVERTIAGKREK